MPPIVIKLSMFMRMHRAAYREANHCLALTVLIVLFLCKSAQAADKAAAEQFVKDGLAKDSDKNLAQPYSDKWHFQEFYAIPRDRSVHHFHTTVTREAEKDFSLAIQADPACADAYYYRGLIYLILGHYAKAVEDLSKALEIAPQMINAHWARAAANHYLKANEQSIADYTVCLSSFDKGESTLDKSACYRKRGEAYEATNNFEAALADYVQAIKLAPTNAEGYRLRYGLYKKVGRGDLASADKARYRQYKDPALPAIQDLERLTANAAQIELREPPEKVREFYLASIKKDPFSEEAHYLFAHWLMRQGNLTEALEQVDQALKLDPKFGQALDLRERISLAQGDKSTAALARNKRDWMGFSDASRDQNKSLNDGMKAREGGDVDLAIQCFSRAIQIDNSFGEAYVRRAEVLEYLAKHFRVVLAHDVDPNRVGETWKITRDELSSFAASDRSIATKLNTTCSESPPLTKILSFGREIQPYQRLNLIVSGKCFLPIVKKKNPYARPEKVWGVSYAQLTSVINDLTKEINSRPDDIAKYEKRARLYIENCYFEKAKVDLNHCLQVNPKQPKILQLRGSIFVRLESWREALVDLDRAIALSPDASMFADRGWVHYKLSQFPQAIADYQKCIALDKKNWKAHQVLGRCYLAQKQYKQAMVHLTKSLELKPDESETLEYRGVVCRLNNEFDKAIADLTASLKAHSEEPQVIYYERGKTFQQKKDYTRAIEDLTESLKIDPEYVYSLRERAACYKATGQTDKAEADYSLIREFLPAEAAIQMSPGGSNAQKTNRLISAGLIDAAIQECSRNLEDNPHDAELLRLRAECYVRMRDMAKAIADETAIVQDNPADFAALRRRGYDRFISSDLKGSLEDLNHALTLAPNEAYILNCRGMVLSASGSYQEAINDFDKVLLLLKGRRSSEQDKQDTARAIVRRADALSMSGQCEEASKQFELVLKSNRSGRPPESDALVLADRGDLISAQQNYRLCQHLCTAMKRNTNPFFRVSPSTNDPDAIDKPFSNRFESNHFMILSNECKERVVFYGQFAEAFRAFIDRELIKVAPGPKQKVYLFANYDQLNHFLKQHNLSEGTDYWPERNAILIQTYLQVYAPLAHILTERAISAIPYIEPWARVGIPQLFHKFFAYYDGDELHPYFAFQNSSTPNALATELRAPSLQKLISTEDFSQMEGKARLVAVFLQKQKKTQEYLRLASGDTCIPYHTRLEGAFYKPIEEIEPLWSAYLEDTKKSAGRWLNLPASETFDSKQELLEFMKEHNIPLPDEK